MPDTNGREPDPGENRTNGNPWGGISRQQRAQAQRKRERGSTARPTFGRRRYDPDSEHMITKRLVVVTVILVDALYLAGDALLLGSDRCL